MRPWYHLEVSASALNLPLAITKVFAGGGAGESGFLQKAGSPAFSPSYPAGSPHLPSCFSLLFGSGKLDVSVRLIEDLTRVPVLGQVDQGDSPKIHSSHGDQMAGFTLDEDQQQIQDMARKFAAKELRPIARDCDEESKLSADVLEKVWQLGFCPNVIPEKYGGYELGRSTLTSAIMVEELAWGDVSLTLGALSPL